MNDKKSFLLFADLKRVVDKLPDETKGKLFQLILDYANGIDAPVEDMWLDVIFEPIKTQLDRDNKKWEEVREKRSKAGKASADKRQQMSTHVESVEHNPTHVDTCEHMSTVSVNVNDTVSVNDTVNVFISPKPSLENLDPIVEIEKRKNLFEGVYKTWQIIAERQEVKFTNDEKNAMKGYAESKPSMQPHQITGAIVQLNDWAQKGLDIRKALLDGIQSNPRSTKLDQPYMAIVYDAKGNRIYGPAIAEWRAKVIEMEEKEQVA